MGPGSTGMKRDQSAPPKIRRFRTEYSGVVEIIQEQGEVYLDTAHANYSYGLLQRILAAGLKGIDTNALRKVLLLGLGGGSVVKTLREDFGFTGHITAVELDKDIIDIALHEFGLVKDKKLEVINGDALQVVSSLDNYYDLIIIDIFIHTEVPGEFYEPPFWMDIHHLLTSRGKFLFNASVGRKGMRALRDLKETMSGHFTYLQLDEVEGANSLLIGALNPTPR